MLEGEPDRRINPNYATEGQAEPLGQQSPPLMGDNTVILRFEEVEHVAEDQLLVAEIEQLMTPDSVLAKNEFKSPELIYPDTYPDFNSLLSERLRIRNLELLPVRSDADLGRYRQSSQERLTDKVRSYLGLSRMVLARNNYPYLLPDDTEQCLVWAKNERDALIPQFIAKAMKVQRLTSNDIILFERPARSTVLIVKGTIPDIHHVHIWMRKPMVSV